MLVRWQPRSLTELITVAHPATGTPEPDLTPVAMFGGYPLAQTPNGVFLADDQVSPFIATFGGLRQPLWHRDIMNRVGVPAVNGSTVFSNVSGENATGGLVAIDSTNGRSLWEFAPDGFAREPIQMYQRVKTREASDAERKTLQSMQATMKARGQSLNVSDASVSLFQGTPGINGTHGHWLNPGLVTSNENVYGQVGSSIVALKQSSGQSVWSFALDKDEVARSLAGSRDHLFVSSGKRLFALNLQSGKLEWSQPMPRAGTLTIANGKIIVAMGANEPGAKDGGEIVVFTPGNPPEEKPAVQAAPPPKR